MLRELEQQSFCVNGEVSVYLWRSNIPIESTFAERGFHNPVGNEQQNFDERMSTVRVSVEWNYGEDEDPAESIWGVLAQRARIHAHEIAF